MFEIAATAALGFIAVIWSSDGLPNQAIKWTFLLLSIWGGVEAAHTLDYFQK